MPQVNLNIRGRDYSLACDEGQEERLRDVAKYVESRMRDIGAAGAAVNEQHLQVLAALVLADEVFDQRHEIAELQEQVRYLQGNPPSAASSEDEDFAAQMIADLAGKIEHIAARIQKA